MSYRKHSKRQYLPIRPGKTVGKYGKPLQAMTGDQFVEAVAKGRVGSTWKEWDDRHDDLKRLLVGEVGRLKTNLRTKNISVALALLRSWKRSSSR